MLRFLRSVLFLSLHSFLQCNDSLTFFPNAIALGEEGCTPESSFFGVKYNPLQIPLRTVFSNKQNENLSPFSCFAAQVTISDYKIPNG